MANDLTGDFDVVAEFSILAANRVIAAMHRVERFLHSMSVRVDDRRRPDHRADFPALIASVDSLGEPSVDHDRIPTRPPLVGVSTPGTASSVFDSIVNTGIVVAELPELVPSSLHGRAQLQLSPPTISVPDSSGTNVTVQMDMRCRYFPDKDTPRLAEFIRGNLSITAPVSQVASQVARVVEIDIKGVNVQTNFVRTWSSEPVSTADLASVNQLIKNSLRTSFLPSSTTLPSSIAHVQFKTLRGAKDALAVMLDMDGGASNPASHHNVFLSGADDFAIGAGVDFVRAKFEPTIASVRGTSFPPVHIPVVNISYTISNSDPHDHRGQVSVDLVLENGRILLTIKGHAHTPHWWAPDFDFTVKQPLTLSPSGATAELVVGDISIDTTSFVADRFKNRIRDAIKTTRDRALDDSDARGIVRRELDANDKLGDLLGSLLRPTPPKPGWLPPDYFLAYSSIEIRPSGIVMHGSLAVKNWAAPHAEFEKIPTTGGGPLAVSDVFGNGPDYSALKSWIPGGAIQQYEWSTPGQTQPFLIDQNKFVYRQQSPGLIATDSGPSTTVAPPPLVSDGSLGPQLLPGYVPLCVTIKGTRLSTSGPVVAEPVSAKICGINSFPVLGDFQVDTAGAMAMVALAQPDPRGMVEVTGHVVARSAPTSAGTPNLIVHFAAEGSAPNLEVLTNGLRESKRDDAVTAILAVVSRDRLASTRYTPGVTYAESGDGSWDRIFKVKSATLPLTLIAGPKRDILWQHQGEVDSRTLAEALRKYLVRTGPARISLMRSSVRIGGSPPNFLFEHAPGAEITLRKLTGQPVTIVFWNGSSKPSIEAVRELEHTGAYEGQQRPVILAVNDGESSEDAKRAGAENKLSATVVPDPAREISRAYGVDIWPTIISIDASGLVSGIRYGRTADESGESPTVQQSAK
jgi:peroxiredoxin